MRTPIKHTLRECRSGQLTRYRFEFGVRGARAGRSRSNASPNWMAAI